EATLGAYHRPAGTVTPDGSVVASVFEAPGEPPELVVLDARQPSRELRRLTRLNEELEAYEVPPAERFEWGAQAGLSLEGILLRPPAAQGVEEPLPLVVIVHGGPTAAWSFGFSAGYFEWGLLLAGAGYAVLLPNPRGSSGRGQEFARANLGDMGGGDLEDILAGIDALVRDGIADDDRVAITGGSYGGFIASSAMTQTDPFAGTRPVAVVTGWTSSHYTANIGQFDALFLQGEPNDPAGPYPKWSPVYHAHRCRTPTLLIHGEDDRCTPLPQATEFYNALVEAG